MTAQIFPIERNLDALSVAQIIATELPYVHAFYPQTDRLHKDVQQWLDFFIQHKQHLPMYGMRESCADALMTQMTQYHAMLLAALRQILKLDVETVRQWFPCKASADPAFVAFFEYARHEFFRQTPYTMNSSTIYGRFDAVIEPESGKLEGIYEFNGDTPVMLFESVNLQNLIATALGKGESQANDWWLLAQEHFAAYRDKNIAVVCDVGFIEDASTTETIAQLFESVGAQVYFTTLEGLNHSVLELEQPFMVDGVATRPDVIFMLLPWEEMWISGKDILAHWPNWNNTVQFLEPAWRWFMSHKGLFAWVTHLLDEDSGFKERWQHLPHLHTTLSPDYFVQAGLDYVSKPAIGRLSQNIRIHQGNTVSQQTGGQYQDESRVYQQYLPPHQVHGRPNFILGGWLSGQRVSTLCFREFDGPVLDLKNERFIAHLLLDTES